MIMTESLIRGTGTYHEENNLSNPLEVREKLFNLKSHYEAKIADINFAINELNMVIKNKENFDKLGILPSEYPIRIKPIEDILKDHGINTDDLE